MLQEHRWPVHGSSSSHPGVVIAFLVGPTARICVFRLCPWVPWFRRRRLRSAADSAEALFPQSSWFHSPLLIRSVWAGCSDCASTNHSNSKSCLTSFSSEPYLPGIGDVINERTTAETWKSIFCGCSKHMHWLHLEFIPLTLVQKQHLVVFRPYGWWAVMKTLSVSTEPKLDRSIERLRFSTQTNFLEVNHTMTRSILHCVLCKPNLTPHQKATRYLGLWGPL